MKKTVYILTILIYTFSNAQIVNIPDANFKNALLSASFTYIAKDTNNNWAAIDTNNDGNIQQSEAENITYLNVRQQLISDLTGIQSFINLTQLHCYNNQLINLDLSNNSSLIQLYCFDNQLTNLELSNNTSLRDLSCSDNQLTNLELSNNISLRDLSCSDNQLTNLDLSNNINLVYLWCNNLPNLTYLNLNNGVNNQMYLDDDEGFSIHNTPNLQTVCVDDVNSALVSEILNQVDHFVTCTENCDTATIYQIIGTKIDFYVYPIPSTDVLSINTKAKIKNVYVYNALGKLVVENSNLNKIDVSNLKQGLYFVKVQDINGNIAIKKIIKK